MKIFKIAICILFCSSSTMAQEFTVDVKVPQAASNAKAYLQVGVKNDTLIVVNGRVVFKGEINETQQASIFVDISGKGQFNHRYTFFLSPGITNLTISDTTGNDKLMVTGNKYAIDFESKLKRPVAEFNEQTAINSKKYKEAQEEGSADTLRLKSIRDNSIYNCFQVPQRYIKENPTSQLCITALKMMGRGASVAKVNIDTLKTLFGGLAPEVKQSVEGKRYEAWLSRL